MLINKFTKTFQTRSDKPNSNWLDTSWYVVSDNSPLAQKVQNLFPRFEFVLNEEGELIDVIEIPKAEKEIIQEKINNIDIELKQIDYEGVTRHLENQIEASGTLDTIYITTKELVERKAELREQRKTLVEKIKKIGGM